MATTDVVVATFSPEELVHIQDIELLLDRTRGSVLDNIFDIGELLSEIHAKRYYLVLNGGNSTFEDWVNHHSDLDMSSRQAYFLVNITDKAKQLGITREQLKAARITKLKDIFTLDASKFAEEIKQLVEEAPDLSYEVVRNRVAKLKPGGEEGEEMAFITIKVPKSVKELWLTVIERIREDYGDNGGDNQPDLSPSRCFELACANYLGGE